MISFRQADLAEKVMKNRRHDVFFYIWFASTPLGYGEMEGPVRDHHGRLSAHLEVFFPDKLTKWDTPDTEAKIKQRVESAIGQPLNMRIYSHPEESISDFYERMRNIFEPKLRQMDDNLEFDSLIRHGMVFRMKILP